MKNARWRRAAYGGSVMCLLAAAPVRAQYGEGYAWNRQADWLPGTTTGTTHNNPGIDAFGHPVWQYEWVTGGGFDSADPWYARPGTLMTWDDEWWSEAIPAWSRADNTSPPVHQMVMTHNLVADQYPYVPLARWRSPLSGDRSVDITGDLRIRWYARPG